MSRYIDADVFMKNLKTNEHGDTDVNQVEIAINKSRADVAEVRHGHWIAVTVSSGRDSWQCSECGRHARGKIENLPYCHCGARMDGDNNE